jgi:hypothetical protein
VGIDNEGDHADALKLLAAGFVRELRFRSEERNGVGDAADAGCTGSAARAAIRTGPPAIGPFARSVVTIRAFADAGWAAGAGGKKADVGRGVDADVGERWIIGELDLDRDGDGGIDGELRVLRMGTCGGVRGISSRWGRRPVMGSMRSLAPPPPPPWAGCAAGGAKRVKSLRWMSPWGVGGRWLMVERNPSRMMSARTPPLAMVAVPMAHGFARTAMRLGVGNGLEVSFRGGSLGGNRVS